MFVKKALFAALICLVVVAVVVIGSAGVFAQSPQSQSQASQPQVSSVGDACFFVLRGEANRLYGVSFPVNYSQFNSKATLYRSRQNMVSTVSKTPQFRQYVYDFGRQTSWIPVSPYFVDKWKPVKEFMITFYYNNDTFEGCGFTKVSASGSYTLSTVSTSKLGESRYGSVAGRDVSKAGFGFNLAQYAFDFKDKGGADMARYDTLSIASDLTPVYKEQFLAGRIVDYAHELQAQQENRALKKEATSASGSAQKSVLVWHAVYWAIIAVLLALLVRAQLKQGKE